MMDFVKEWKTSLEKEKMLVYKHFLLFSRCFQKTSTVKFIQTRNCMEKIEEKTLIMNSQCPKYNKRLDSAIKRPSGNSEEIGCKD